MLNVPTVVFALFGPAVVTELFDRVIDCAIGFTVTVMVGVMDTDWAFAKGNNPTRNHVTAKKHHLILTSNFSAGCIAYRCRVVTPSSWAEFT